MQLYSKATRLLLLRIATIVVSAAGLSALALIYQSNARLLQQKYPVNRATCVAIDRDVVKLRPL